LVKGICKKAAEKDKQPPVPNALFCLEPQQCYENSLAHVHSYKITYSLAIFHMLAKKTSNIKFKTVMYQVTMRKPHWTTLFSTTI